jgi:hypothetical protein
MKTQEEIEQLAAREYWNSNTESRSFIKGYTQCQEDVKPLIHDLWQLWEDLAEACDLQIDTPFSRKFNEIEKQINNGKNNP